MSCVITEAEAMRRKKEAAEAKRWYVLHGTPDELLLHRVLGPFTKGEALRVRDHLVSRNHGANIAEQSPIDPGDALADTET